MTEFAHPLFLFLLLFIPILIGIRVRRRVHSAIEYSSILQDWDLQPSFRQRVSFLPFTLFILSLAISILALARPRKGNEQTVVDSEGIAIELVVDRSSSMNAWDFQLDGQRVDRLAAIKDVAAKFVLGEEESVQLFKQRENSPRGRIADRIGLITFAGFADAITPPSLDHRFLVRKLEQASIVSSRNEDGTAIGDALSLAVEKLQSLKTKSGDPIKSKVVILLTDGENTRGEVEPLDAAELAKQFGVKVYTIGVGTKGQAPVPVSRTRSGQIMVEYVQVNIDEETLKSIANSTGGLYFRATDTDSLAKIYQQIDELEKTEFVSEDFVSYREWSVEPFRLAGWKMPPILSIAVVLLCLSVLLSRTVFRELQA